MINRNGLLNGLIMQSNIRTSLKISMISICAGLYTLSIATTSFIPTPWGVGQFRWGVIFPALFAILGGPWVAGLGAAIGTFLGSYILMLYGLSNPVLSLFAGVPANFISFFLFGYFIKRYRNWSSLIWIALLTLFIGNFIAAFNTVIFYSFFVNPALNKFAYLIQSNDWFIRLSIVFGLLLFWLLTMFPIIVFGLPPLARAISPIIKSYRIGVTLNLESPSIVLPKSIVAGLGVLLISFLIYFTPLSNVLTGILRISATGLVYLFYLSLFTSGILFIVPYIIARSLRKS